MKTFRNKHYTKRDYESTNVVACQADEPPSDSWVECNPEDVLPGLTPLWIEKGVRYFGHL